MVPDRLTPFERIEDNRTLSGPQVESVDDLIAKRKAYNRKVKRNRWLKRLGVFLLTLTLAFLSYAYIITPLSTVNRIEIIGNHMLSKQEILSTLKITQGTPVYQLDIAALNETLTSIDLVKQGQIILTDHNTIRIELIERRGVALILLPSELILLTDEAEFITMSAQRLLLNMNLPLVVGMDDSTELSDLALILGTLNDEILVNISEIHKEKTLYNEPQLRLMMQEGNTVFAPLSALSALDKYLQVVKMTNETNSCFSIADISFSLVKLECPTH